MDDLEVIWVNDLDIDALSDTICLEILKEIVALQNEDNK